MGSIDNARVSSGPYWQLVAEALDDSETPVHCAHLRLVQGSTDVFGTLFLTDRQVMWRVIDPRQPAGASKDFDVADVLTVDRDTKLSIFHGFRLVVSADGLPEDYFFFPQHKTEVDRMLSDQMFAEVRSAWEQSRQAA